MGEVHYAVYALLGCKSVLTVHDIGFWTSDKFKTIKRFGLYFTHLYPIKLAKELLPSLTLPNRVVQRATLY